MATPVRDESQNVRQRLSNLFDRMLVRAKNGYALDNKLHKMASML